MLDPLPHEPDRPSRLARAAALCGATGKLCPAARATQLLEAMDATVGSHRGLSHDLSKSIASEDLREAYDGYCAQHRLRALSPDALGKRLTGIFGPRVRLSAAGVRRPWGFAMEKNVPWL
jgi:hypothetical protein